MMTVRDAAIAAHAAGINVIPIRGDGSKAPTCRWGHWNQERQPREDVEDLFRVIFGRGRAGLALIGGEVSGGLVLLDFDDRQVFTRWKRAARKHYPNVLATLLTGFHVKTPRGARLAFRTSLHVASGPIAPGVDVKARGGYAIIAPSLPAVHPTGKLYLQQAGSFDTIPSLSAEEAQQVLESLRELDSRPGSQRPTRRALPREQKPLPTIDALKEPPKPTDGQVMDPAPSTDFDLRADWAQLLEPAGWECVVKYNCINEDTDESWTEARWRRPDKDEVGHSGTTNHNGNCRFVCFSTNGAPFENWSDTHKSYRKFEAWALLAGFADPRSSEVLLALRAAGYGRR